MLDLLRAASERATASSITTNGKPSIASFELNVVEVPTVPTADQLRSILDYVGRNRAGEVVKGALSESDAAKILGEGGAVAASERLQRPLLVDWNNGRAGTSFRGLSVSFWEANGLLVQFLEQMKEPS